MGGETGKDERRVRVRKNSLKASKKEVKRGPGRVGKKEAGSEGPCMMAALSHRGHVLSRKTAGPCVRAQVGRGGSRREGGVCRQREAKSKRGEERGPESASEGRPIVLGPDALAVVGRRVVLGDGRVGLWRNGRRLGRWRMLLVVLLLQACGRIVASLPPTGHPAAAAVEGLLLLDR
jgi:hypothetical protein